MTIKIDDRAYKRVLRKLDKAQLLTNPLERFLTRAGTRLIQAGMEHAPKKTGRLFRSLKLKLDKNRPPRQVTVGTNVNHEEFPYPLALDAGSFKRRRSGAVGYMLEVLGFGVSGTYHYARGPFAGQPTGGWFSERSVSDAQGDINRYLRDVGRDVKRDWDRR